MITIQFGCGLIRIGREWGFKTKDIPTLEESQKFLEQSIEFGIRFLIPRLHMVERMDFFFLGEGITQEPLNAEPHKCDKIKWFPLDELPDNTIPFIKKQLVNIYKKASILKLGGSVRLVDET